MIWALTVYAFLATAFIAVVVFYVFSRRHEIWEALKKAQQTRAKGAGGQVKQDSDRRRSERLVLCVPVVVFGHGIDGGFFHEETMTQQVNAHGGLLCLATRVKTGQSLWLTNKLTLDQQECHVVRLGLQRLEKTDVGVEFTRPAPDFWRTES